MWKKITAGLLMAACLIDFSLPYFLGRFYPGFDQRTMIISQLGEESSPVHTAFNRGSVLTGTLFLLAACSLYFFVEDEAKTLKKVLALSIGLYGLGDCLLTGLVHISESASFFSPAYFLHAAFSGIAMVAMMFVPLLLAYRAALAHQKGRELFYAGCLVGSLLALFLFAAYYLPGIGYLLSSTRGFWQRLSLFFLYLPAIGLSFRLLKKERL